jgi:membrane dipeptidase
MPVLHIQLLTTLQITELFDRGWTAQELRGLTGGNLLRVLEGAERVAQELQKAGTLPVLDLYDKRPDLPVHRG